MLFALVALAWDVSISDKIFVTPNDLIDLSAGQLSDRQGWLTKVPRTRGKPENGKIFFMTP